MTREEQIIEASQLYAKHQQKPFMDGALWADTHPTDEVLKLRKMFESDPDAYKQGYKEAFDKAYKWLSEQMFELYDCGEIYVADGIASSLEEFLNNFKQAMEE